MKNILKIIYTEQQRSEFKTNANQPNKVVLCSIEESDDAPIEIDELEIEKLYLYL